MNDNTNLPEIHSARKIPLSELRGLLLSEKLSLPDYLSSLFVDRLVVNVRVEDGGRFWLFQFDQGPPIYIEPIVTNHGCHGMCAGLSSDSDSVLPNAHVQPRQTQPLTLKNMKNQTNQSTASDETPCSAKYGPDYERAMKRYSAKYRESEKKYRELLKAVKPVIEAISNLTDTDDWRGVGKAMVRCHALLDKFPDLLQQNADVLAPADIDRTLSRD